MHSCVVCSHTAAIQLTSSCPIYVHSKHDRAVFGVRSHFSSRTCLSLQIYLMTWLPFMQNANTLHGHFFLSSWFISRFVTAFLSEAEQRTGSQTEQSSFLGLIQSFIVRNSSWQRRTQYMRVWDTVEASRSERPAIRTHVFVSKVSDLHMKCSFWLTSRPRCGPSWWKMAGNCRLLTCTQIASRGAFAVGSIRKHGIRESVFEAEIWRSSSCLHLETALLKERLSVHVFSCKQYLLKTIKRRTKMWVCVIALCRCTTLFCLAFLLSLVCVVQQKSIIWAETTKSLQHQVSFFSGPS